MLLLLGIIHNIWPLKPMSIISVPKQKIITSRPIAGAIRIDEVTSNKALDLKLGADAQANYELGLLSLVSVQPIEHSFVVRNTDTQSITLTDLRPSCGCTTAFVETTEVAKLPYVLKAGEEAKIHLTVNPSDLTPGKFDKSVAIYVQGKSQPMAKLHLNFTALPFATFSNHVLDFTQANTGPSRTVPFVVTFDPQRLPADVVAHLECSNPDVTVVATNPPNTPVPGAQTYQATLSPKAHLGKIDGKIEMVLTATNADGKKVDYPGGSMPLTGAVLGGITANPDTMTFGSVRAADKKTQQIVLNGTTPEELESLKITVDKPFLSSNLNEASSNALQSMSRPFGSTTISSEIAVDKKQTAKNAIALLDVSLGPNAPVGAFSGQITIMTRKGEVLILPVRASVIP